MEREKRIKRMSITAGANAFTAVYSGISFLFTGNTIYTGEFKHSGSDTLVYGSRLYAEHHGYDQHTKKFRNFLRLTMALPAVFLLRDAHGAFQDIIDTVNVTQNVANADYLGATVIASANTVAYVASNGVEEHSHASEANLSHAIADLGASYVYTGGLALEASGVLNGGSTWGTLVGSGIAGLHLAIEAIKPHKH